MGLAVSRKISPETLYLRELAKVFSGDVGWDERARAEMLREGIFLPQVLQVMQNGIVVRSEKDDAYGARWWVTGETCDHEELSLLLEVFCDRNLVIVLRVSRL